MLAPELAADERFRKRFLRESQLAASLDHPNIVPIYAAGEEGGLLYLAMRYVEGYDLRELVDSTPGGLEPAQALRLLGPVADALDAAHALGLVHRDVKPANVLIVAGRDRAARTSATSASPATRSSAESLTGDAGLRRHDRLHRARADRVRHRRRAGRRLLARLRPLRVPDRRAAVRRATATSRSSSPTSTSRRRCSPPRGPELPPQIDAVVQKALAKEPDERYSTCAELVAEAAAALEVGAPAKVAARSGGRSPVSARS